MMEQKLGDCGGKKRNCDCSILCFFYYWTAVLPENKRDTYKHHQINYKMCESISFLFSRVLSSSVTLTRVRWTIVIIISRGGV